MDGAGGLVGLGLDGFCDVVVVVVFSIFEENETDFLDDVAEWCFRRDALIYTLPLNIGTFESAFVISNQTYVFL